MTDTPREQILKHSKMAEKFFEFEEHADVTQPAQWWFQHSEEGLVLFCVFYTLACRWNLCVGCNLPSKSSIENVTYGDIIAQIDHLFERPEIAREKDNIHKLIISNNGSVLDQVTFPSTALMYLLARINTTFNNLTVLSIETRVEYVEWEELEFIARALKEREKPAILELAIGFEVFDERIRNRDFKKGLSLSSVEKLAKMVGRHGYSLKCYFMLKPVEALSGERGIDDIRLGIEWLHGLTEKYNTDINIHLNPTYVAYGTDLEKQFRAGEYTPPHIVDAARAALYAKDTNVSVFLGLYDEGLAVPGGSFVREGDAAIIEKLETFNQNQDFAILEEVISTYDATGVSSSLR